MSREKKHTPGPWVAEVDEFSCNVETSDRMFWVCQLWNKCEEFFHVRSEREANANLIAAAPELLEALEAIELDDLPMRPGSIHLMRQAILKAYGEQSKKPL